MDEPEADLLEAGVTFDVAGVEFDPAQHGYTAVHNYASYFWRPYLGNTAFSLWELLLSFCYGDKDVAFPSISRLARMLTNSDHSRAIVTGRRRSAPRSGAAEETAPAAAVSRCEGALEVLRRERLIRISGDGEGRTSSYTFRVCKTLPVLRPDQVARLSPALQLDHRIWLRRRGIDPQTYQQAFAAPAGSARTAGRRGTPLPAPPEVAGTAVTCRSPAPTAAAGTERHDAPCAQRTSPGAPGTEGAAVGTRGAAADTRGAAPGTGNNPQEGYPSNQWWQEAMNEVRPQLLRDTFNVCVRTTRVRSFADGVLTLQAVTAPVREVLRHRLSPLLQRALEVSSQGQVRGIVVE